MKACSYCGRENDAEANRCRECGTGFDGNSPAAANSRAPAAASREWIDLDPIDGVVQFEHGFSRLNWKLIATRIDALEFSSRKPAWDSAAHQWLERLQSDLGGDYQISLSDSFFLLSGLAASQAANLLQFAERADEIIQNNLRDVAWLPFGKQVILVFAEEDDYYEYTGYFYAADEIPPSLGVYLGTGYPHFALTYRSEIDAAHTIAHELAHGCLMHLPLPRWLDEGVAETLRRLIGGPQPRVDESHSAAYWTAVSGWRPPLMWDELAERHHAFWNEHRIQSFWAGTSFYDSQEARELSYSLAEVVVHLLSGDHDGFLGFISHAHYDDAGQGACIDFIGRNLGDILAEFLGPGNWRPYRKAMVECWNHSRHWSSSGESTADDKAERDDQRRMRSVMTACNCHTHPGRLCFAFRWPP